MSEPRPNPCNADQYFEWLWKCAELIKNKDLGLRTLFQEIVCKTICRDFFDQGIAWAESKSKGKSDLTEVGIEKTGDHLQQVINRLAAVVAPGETGLTLDDLVARVEKTK